MVYSQNRESLHSYMPPDQGLRMAICCFDWSILSRKWVTILYKLKPRNLAAS